MMKNFNDFRGFLLADGVDPQVVDVICKVIETSCSWLLKDEEISEDIGVDLFREELGGDVEAVGIYRKIIQEHNRRVGDVSRGDVSDAVYSKLVAIVGEFGVEDAFGDGDYWVVSDSISNGRVSIVAFKDRILPEGLVRRLSEYIRQGAGIKSLTVIDPEGAVLWHWKT